MTSNAERLFAAARVRTPIEPLTDADPELTVDEAYAIQDELIGLYELDGDRVIGAKLGLTSPAKQLQMGIAEPIRGWLTQQMILAPGEGLQVDSLGQPRAEPEIAFILGRGLAGADSSPTDVLEAVDSVHPAIEILDSRYAGYRFTLPDVIADNTSGGRFVLGPGHALADIPDLGLLGCVFEADGTLRGTAAGAATMGHPALATAWLARGLAGRDRTLRAGDIVLTGGLTAVVELRAGMRVVASFDRIGSVTLECR